MMLVDGAAVAIALLLASTAASESNPWSDLLKQLEQLMPPKAWAVLFVGFIVFAFFLTIGDQLSGILSWLGVPSPLQRKTSSSIGPQVIRRQLLGIVKKEVNRRLATSLHNLVKLDLYMEDQRQQVGNPKLELVPEDPPKDNEPSFQAVNRVLHPKGNKPPLDLKLTQKIIEVFERQDIGGKLLILGEPGSGKSTELLQLAKDLVTRVEEDDQHPMPVILELSSWNGESIDRWVASQLKKLYSLSKDVTQQWLASNQILLLLDGLDELGLTKQKQCIEQINQFLETTRTSEIVVCCRREEYEAGKIELDGLNGAIYLEALKEDQIRQYFEELNRLNLWDNIRGNSALRELAEKPLFLFMLIVAYQGNPIQNQQELFDAYIAKQLHEPSNQGIYKPGTEPTPQQTRHYLVWLAKQLENIHETEFLIEGLQPIWLTSSKLRRLYRLLTGIFLGLLIGLFMGLIGGLLGGQTIGLGIGTIGGLYIGIVGGLGHLDIKSTEKLQWSFGKVIQAGLLYGLLGGLLLFGLAEEATGWELLVASLAICLISGLLFGISGVSITAKETPNQGIRKSIQYAFLSGLMVGPFFGLALLLHKDLLTVLTSAMLFVMLVALIKGLDVIFRHFILRIFLTKNGDTPWNYARFLDHAVKHRFIQRTGGRYRFVHDLLRKHFAAMPLE